MSVVSDGAITAARAERKYLVASDQLAALTRSFDERLRQHHHNADSPLAAISLHYTTTVYFDTGDRQLYAAAVRAAEHIKLRAREYYDTLPLAEVATDERELWRSEPILWLELKRRDGDHSGKRRVGVPKRRLHSFFERPVVDAELLAIQQQAHGSEGNEVFDEVLGFLAEFDEPLRPSCIVNYRRRAWQNGDGTIRVTLDEDLSAFPPRDTIWKTSAPLRREALGAPALVRNDAVLEVKRRCDEPDWLHALLGSASIKPADLSKFVMASAALLEVPSGYSFPPPAP